jgi:hypothetical protein
LRAEETGNAILVGFDGTGGDDMEMRLWKYFTSSDMLIFAAGIFSFISSGRYERINAVGSSHIRPAHHTRSVRRL